LLFIQFGFAIAIWHNIPAHHVTTGAVTILLTRFYNILKTSDKTRKFVQCTTERIFVAFLARGANPLCIRASKLIKESHGAALILWIALG
jgi:hypothetical protein